MTDAPLNTDANTPYENVKPGIHAPTIARYMGAPVELATAPNGAVVNRVALERLRASEPHTPEVRKIADGVWSVIGHSLVNVHVIEGERGLIVYDTGFSVKEAETILRDIRKISTKPVTAIIYSHWHYIWGAGVIADGNKDVEIVAHPNLPKNLASPDLPIPELDILQNVRAMQQFNNFMPSEGQDAAIAPLMDFKPERAMLPPTRIVEHEEEAVIDGVRMRFLTRYGSDADDCITVWLPERKVVLTNMLWHAIPNVYPLRGAAFRDPRSWIAGLREIRDLNPDYVLSTHTFPIMGADASRKTVTGYMDALAFIYDQTVRGALKGLGLQDLKHVLVLPKALSDIAQNAEVYGELSAFPQAIFQHALGWFDGDAATINTLPTVVEAQKIAELAGGRDRLMSAAENALEKGEYAWAAQLANYLYRLDPLDPAVRSTKAAALRKMARAATGSIARAFLISQARALEGSTKIPRVLFMPVARLMLANPAVLVNHFRVRIDPLKAEGVDCVLAVRFTDVDKTYGLHVRNGVAEFVADPASHYQQAEDAIVLPRLAWAKFYNGEYDVDALLADPTTDIEGSRERVRAFLGRFDHFDPKTNFSIPPLD
ncbi:Putative alkyl/aryl-sulfatase YjcS [Paraburkholderia caffeinitolerans]|uniref:Alkyl/aryl-sulfatase YjcS n=1 Tax=Paraburkholderia caffeinitolerans TaxID=1723730 RepID=A0A6J5FHM4_9BURK|nr:MULTISPECIES: alkyl sulfatase dimerization domain-containing protein [Paraburkholderia]CAB3778398.1 Putative alkyl/aryl-sulfatase YjcS [Paraburkholderia caffeinitolerans]